MEPYRSNYSIMDLPKDMTLEIFSNFNFSGLGVIIQVHNKWKEDLTERFNMKRQALCQCNVFGTKEWETHFNFIFSQEEEYEALNTLPLNIDEITCPIDPSKMMIETHVFTYFPKGLTLKRYGELLKQKFPGNAKGYRNISDKILRNYGDKPVNKGWRAMTKEALPDSLDVCADAKKNMISRLNSPSFCTYRSPSALEAIVLISTEYFRTGEKIFSAYFTSCQEGIGGCNLSVNSSRSGFNILRKKNVYETNHIGVAALRDY